jgi:hypothetical protein
MAKRTPSPQAKAADLHTTPAQDVVTMSSGNAQPLPPVVKSSDKSKVKNKFKTLRDDESLSPDEDIIGNAQGDQISLDVSENVLVAQANTSSSATSAPSSVGEALLREAQLAPAAASQTGAGLFDSSLAWPVALGVGGLAVVASASGGDKPVPTPTPAPAPAPEKPSEPVTPTTYDLKIMPMVGPINGGITINVKDSRGVLLAQLKVDSMGSEPLTLQVERSKLSAGQVLHLELVDANGTGVNYRDVATNKSFSLATQLNAWTVVPNDIADKGTLQLAITPLTELAANEMLAAKTAAADTSAPTQDEVLVYNNAIAKLFKLQTSGDNALDVDLAQTHPVATNAGSTFSTASASQQAYGRVLALISGLAKTSNSTSDLAAALQVLQSGIQQNDGTFSMTPDLTAALQKALASYNQSASATFFKLPGLVLTETQLSLGEKRVAYDQYDNGLSFKLYAPPGLAVGTEVTIRLQALDANGQPIEGKTFDFVHKLTAANDKAAYTGEIVIIPTLKGDIQFDARVPVADKNGHTLIAWNAAGQPNGAGVPDANGIYSFEASVVGQNWPVGNTQFKVDGHRVSVTNIGNTEIATATATPAGYVKQGDTIQVKVVLDNDILWSDMEDKRPTFTIGYKRIDDTTGEPVDDIKTLTVKEGIVSADLTLPDSGIVSDGNTRSTTMGRTLVFEYTFGPDEKVVGPITVGENALQAPDGAEKEIVTLGSKFPADGQSLSALVSGGTQLSTTHLVVDTVAPEVEKLICIEIDTPTKEFPVGGEDVSFTKDTTPNFSLTLKLNNESAGLLVKLYAYAANADRSTAVQIAQTAVEPGANSVSFADASAYVPTSSFYTTNWQPFLNKLGAQGQYFGFYAEVVDAAGNIAQTLENDDAKLWLDNAAPVAFTVQFEPSLSSVDTDPNATDSVTSDSTPTFTVTGEGGATAHLYLDKNKDGVLDAEDVALGSVLINGDYGNESVGAELTIEEAKKLEDGEHQFLLTLTDAAGNTSATKLAGSVTVDTQVEGSVTAALVQPTSGYYRAGDTLTITLSFAEKISKNPLYEGDLANAYIRFTVGEDSYEAKLDTSSLGTSSLRFTYTFEAANIHDGVQVVLGRADLYEAPEGALVDRAGNTVTNLLLSGKTVTDPGTVLVDTVAPAAPELVLSSKATSDNFLVNLAEALNEVGGLYQVTAEAGSTVALNFKQGDKTVPWKTINGAGTSTPVVLTEEELTALGLFGSEPITLQAISTDAAGNQSTATTDFTLDVVAPHVQGVTDNQSASVVGKRTAGVDTVIQFTVTLNEALKTPLSETHFAVKDGMGTVSSVTANANGTYTVAVTPASDKEGDLVLQLTNTTGITDLAGNPLLARDLDTAGGKQTIDTKPPVVKTVTDNITTDLTNGPIVFTVEFNEAIQDKIGYGPSNFSATHGTVTQVQRTSATTYTVTVQPDANLDGKSADSDVVLSLQAGRSSQFEDVNGNILTVAPGVPIPLQDKGAVQRVDNVAPQAPTLSLKEGVGTVTAAEAMAGLINLTTESGTTVSVTYKGVKQTLQKPVFTATDTDMLSLSADDVRALGDGAVQVDVVVQDAVGNTSAGSLVGGFTLDTRAPAVISVTDLMAGPLGGAQPFTMTVTFDEEVVGTPTAANFVAIDPVSKASSTLVEALTDANVTRIDAKTFTVTLTPNQGVTGAVSLNFKGTGLADAAGNALADADLSALNSQAIHTQAPQVTTVTDTFAPEYANVTSTVDFIVTFNTALKSDLSASVLKSGFAATLGTVTAVTAVSGSGNLQYKVSIIPTADVADGQISLQLTGEGLVDALGNRVQATSASSPLGGHVQLLDSSAPAAPTVSLAVGSDTGSSNSDGITSNNRPSMEISGVEVGADVRVYIDADNSGTFTTGDTVLVQAKATSATLTAQVSPAMADGTYNNIRVSQTDAHGNASPDGVMGTLEISTSAPGVLSKLILDETQDTTYIGSSVRAPRDQQTDRAAPKFDFIGGTVGNTVVLFNDKNTNNQLDDGEFLGSADITSEVSSAVQVSPYHALTEGSYPNVKVLQVSASGVSGAASTALRGESGQVLKITPATPTAITIASSEAATPSNKNTLVFSVTGALEGSTIQVLADQYDASGSTLVASGAKLREGVATSSLSDNLTIDVSALNGQFKNFKAYQRFGGVDGDITNVTGLTTVILDHAAPTLSITTTDADLTLNDTAELTFSFSEKVTGFDVSDITGLGEGNLGALTTTDDGKTWTATYTPVANATQNLSVGVAAGAVTDPVGNASTTAANVTIQVHTAQAPVITIAPEAFRADLYAGIAAAIGGVGIQDANGDLSSVTLSVARGNLSLGAVDAAAISLTEAGTTLTLSKPTTATAEAFATALSAALSNLRYTASGTAASTDTLTIRAVDSLNNTQEDSVALTVLAAPLAPVNALAAPATDVFSGQAQAMALSVRDDDNNLQTVVVSAEHGALTVAPDAGITATPGSDGHSLTLTGTQSAIASALASLKYTSDTAYFGTETLRVVSTDGTPAVAQGPLTDTDSITFTVKAKPVSNAGADVAAGQIYAGVAYSLQGLSVSDLDQGIQSVKLSVSAGALRTSGGAPAHLSLAGEGTTSLTFTKNASAPATDFETELQTVLNGLSFTASGAASDSAPVVLTLTSTDSDGFTGTDTANLVVQAAPLAPVNSLPTSPVGVVAGQAKALTGLSVSDADGNLKQIELSVAQGNLTLSTTPDEGVEVTGLGSNKLTLSVTNVADMAKLNTALANLLYTAEAGYSGDDSVSMVSTDATPVAAAGPLADTDTLSLVVLAAPVNSMGSLASVVQAGTPAALTGLSVADADSASTFTSVTLSVAHGTLSLSATEGVTSSGTGSAVAPLELRATSLDLLNQALATVKYNADADFVGTDTLTLTSQDGSATSLGGPLSDTDTLSLNVGNSPASGSVTISGDATVDTLLSANTADLRDANGLGTLSYKWYAGDAEVGTNSTYQLTTADLGKAFRLEVGYTDGAGQSESITSLSTAEVTLPTSLALGKALAFTNDPANGDITDGALSTSSGAFVFGQNGYYVLDVNGDGTITGADRTTYAADLDAEGRLTTSTGVTLQLLSVTEWQAANAQLLESLGWPNGSKDDTSNNASDGFDFWTRDAGDIGYQQVYSNNGVYSVSKDFSGYENALHFHAFKVI